MSRTQSPLCQLKSEPGTTYYKLCRFLADQKWEEADKETKKLIVKVADANNNEFDEYELKDLSCDDLKIIDDLWNQHSGGKFGFKVQQSKYQKSEEKNKEDAGIQQVYLDFGSSIGWMRNDKWKNHEAIYKLKDAPAGHLPALVHPPINENQFQELVILSRFASCSQSTKS